MSIHITQGYYPTNAAAFTLEFATNVFLPTFSLTNSEPTIVIGGQNVIISPISDSQMFFRLTQ